MKWPLLQARADWLEERRRRRQDRELREVVEKKAEEFREYQRKYGEQTKKMTMKRPSKFFLIKGTLQSRYPKRCEDVYWDGNTFVDDKMQSCIFVTKSAAEYAAQTAFERELDSEPGDNYLDPRVRDVRVVPVNRIATSEAERSVMWRFEPVVDLASDHLENLVRYLERGECSYGENAFEVMRVARMELKRRGRKAP